VSGTVSFTLSRSCACVLVHSLIATHSITHTRSLTYTYTLSRTHIYTLSLSLSLSLSFFLSLSLSLSFTKTLTHSFMHTQQSPKSDLETTNHLSPSLKNCARSAQPASKSSSKSPPSRKQWETWTWRPNTSLCWPIESQLTRSCWPDSHISV